MAEDSDLILAATVPECGALLLLKRPSCGYPGHENSAPSRRSLRCRRSATGRVAAGRNCYLYVACGVGGRTALLQCVGILTTILISEGALAPHSIAVIEATSRHFGSVP